MVDLTENLVIILLGINIPTERHRWWEWIKNITQLYDV